MSRHYEYNDGFSPCSLKIHQSKTRFAPPTCPKKLHPCSNSYVRKAPNLKFIKLSSSDARASSESYLESVIPANGDHRSVEHGPHEDDVAVPLPEPSVHLGQGAAGEPELDELPAPQQRDVEGTCRWTDAGMEGSGVVNPQPLAGPGGLWGHGPRKIRSGLVTHQKVTKTIN